MLENDVTFFNKWSTYFSVILKEWVVAIVILVMYSSTFIVFLTYLNDTYFAVVSFA